MKKLLIGYTSIVAFLMISIITAMVLPNNSELSNALDNGTTGSNGNADYCRMTRSDLDRDPLKTCNPLVGGYLGGLGRVEIGPAVNLNNATVPNPVDTRCSVIQWDGIEGTNDFYVQYSADAWNYCHYEIDNDYCQLNGVRGPFNDANLSILKTQFEQKCSPVTPTATATPAPTATSTPRPTATSTPRPTATSTPRPTATSTPRPTATSTPRPTATSTPRPTATSTPRPTATSTPRPTATSTPRPTATSTPRPTATSTPTPTVTPTLTPTPTLTMTPSPTPTGTLVPSPTPTITYTPSPTVTLTPTPTNTLTPTPTVTITVTPTVTATPVITPTPPVQGEETSFGFNISKTVIGKLNYHVGELITFNVNFKNTGTEKITNLYMRDIYTTDIRVEKVTLIYNNQRTDISSIFFKTLDDRDNGILVPKDPNNNSTLYDFTTLTGDLAQNDQFTLEFVFKAIGKNDLVCNEAYTSPNGRKEIKSPKVCVGIEAIVPVTD